MTGVVSFRNLTLSLGSALAALASPLAAQGHFEARDAEFLFSDVGFPAVVDTFAVMTVRRFPDPRLGVQLRYRSPIVPRPFDIYVYPIGGEPGEEGLRERLHQEFERAMEGLMRYSEGEEEGLEVTVEATDSILVVGPSDRQFVGWRATLTLRRESASLHSLLYLFEKDGWFLKYRITHDRAVREFLRDRVTAFVRETVDAVEVAVTSRAVGSPAGKP